VYTKKPVRKCLEEEKNEKFARTLEMLGTIYFKQNDNIKAKEMLLEAHSLFLELNEETNASTAAVAFKLGQTFDRFSMLTSAMDYYKECLYTREQLYGLENENVALVLFMMGKNALSRSNVDESIRFLEKSLEIRRKIHSVNNDLIASVLFELGTSYRSNKSMDKALLCYREALRIWKLLDNNSKVTNVSLTMAKLFEEEKKTTLAIKSYLESAAFIPEGDHRLLVLHSHLGVLYENNNELKESIHHFEISRKLHQNNDDKKDLVHILLSLSSVYIKAKKYNDALQCNKDLIVHQSDPTSLAEIFHSMGNIYGELSLRSESLEYFNKSLSIRRGLKNPDLVSIAILLLDLAKVHEMQNNCLVASEYLVEALRTFRLKRDHKNTTETLDTLARIKIRNHNFEAAKECYEDCINIKEEYYGELDSSTASTLHNFGCLLVQMNDSDGALEIFERTLRIRKKELGLNERNTLKTMQKIGEIYVERRNHTAALRCFQEALPNLSKAYDSNHNEVAQCNEMIAKIHCENKHFHEAIKYFIEALRIQKISATSNQIRISTLYHDLGHTLCMTSDFSGATEYLEKAVEIRRELFTTDSLKCAESVSWLAESHYNCKRMNEAFLCCKDALKFLKRNCSAHVLLFAQTQACCAKVLFHLEDFDNALSSFDSSLQIYQSSECDFDEEIATISLFKGKIYAKQAGNLNLAMDQFKICLVLRKKQGAETEAVAEVLMEVGDVLLEQNQFSSSLNCFRESLRIRKIDNKNDLLIGDVLSKMGEAHLKEQKYDDAMKCCDEARQMYLRTCEEDCIQLGHLAYTIGLIYAGNDKGEEALLSFKSALDLLRKNLNSNDDRIALCMYKSGTILTNKEEYSEAEKLLVNSLSIYRVNLSSNRKDMADAMKQLANTYSKTGNINQALSLYEESSDMYKQMNRHSELASCLSEIGSLRLKSDELNESCKCYEQAWHLHQRHKLNDQGEAATILYGLGFIYNQNLRYDEAMELLKISLKIRLKKLGKQNLDVANTCEQLGTSLVSLGRYEDALKVCTTSLEIYRDLLGENHICCARVLFLLGTIYSHKQNYDLSLVQLQACLEFFKSICGKNSEEVATVLLRIGQIHDLRVDHDEAMKCMTEALDIRTQIYGEEDVRVAETILNIARILEDWGDNDEAMECFHNALHIYEICGDELALADLHNEIGGLHAEKEEFDSALNYYQKALSIFQGKVGNESAEVGSTLRNIGAIYDAKNDISTSYKYYSNSLKILRSVLGDEGLGVALVLNNLGINLARRKKYAKAFDYCKGALRIRRKLLTPGHLDIADTLFNIANILDDTGDKDEQAMKFYTEALSTYKANFGETENEDIANCLKSIGYIHMRQGETHDAIHRFSEALRIFRMNQGNNSLIVSSLLYNLGRTFGKRTEYEKALGCFTECLRIRTELLGPEHKDTIDTKKFVDAINRKVGR